VELIDGVGDRADGRQLVQGGTGPTSAASAQRSRSADRAVRVAWRRCCGCAIGSHASRPCACYCSSGCRRQGEARVLVTSSTWRQAKASQAHPAARSNNGRRCGCSRITHAYGGARGLDLSVLSLALCGRASWTSLAIEMWLRRRRGSAATNTPKSAVTTPPCPHEHPVNKQAGF
jgi:hypothetical protein